MRVAVASAENSSTTQHFGRALQFHIFDLTSTGIQLTERRTNAPACYCGDHEATLAGSVNLISDCQAVVASRIGPGARQSLTERGITPVEIYDFVERAIARFAKSAKAVPGWREDRPQ